MVRIDRPRELFKDMSLFPKRERSDRIRMELKTADLIVLGRQCPYIYYTSTCDQASFFELFFCKKTSLSRRVEYVMDEWMSQ